MKKLYILLLCAAVAHVGFSQESGLVSRDSLKSVLLEIKDLAKSGEVDEALAKIDFYETHNPKLENQLHGEFILKDARKRIERHRKRATQKGTLKSADETLARPVDLAWQSKPDVALPDSIDDGEAEELWRRVALLADSSQTELIVIGEPWSSQPERQDVAQQNVQNAPNSSHELRVRAHALSHLNASKKLKKVWILGLVVGTVLVDATPAILVVALIVAPVLMVISTIKIKKARNTLEYGMLY